FLSATPPTAFSTLSLHALFRSRAVFDCFRGPLQELTHVRRQGPTIFLSLLGFAYTEIQGHLRRYTMAHFGDVIQLLLTLLHEARSEEHTSELQSRENLVCRLLL